MAMNHPGDLAPGVFQVSSKGFLANLDINRKGRAIFASLLPYMSARQLPWGYYGAGTW